MSESSSLSEESYGTTSGQPWCCGEPLTAQRIVVDFAPTEEDTGFVQQKCIDFWNMVRNSPELQGLRIEPEMSERFILEPSETAIKDPSGSQLKEKTALSFLGFAAEKGMVGGAFETHRPPFCENISEDYDDGFFSTSGNKYACKICKCSETCKPCKHKHPSLVEAEQLNKVMLDWDSQHPKSMEPPGQVSTV